MECSGSVSSMTAELSRGAPSAPTIAGLIDGGFAMEGGGSSGAGPLPPRPQSSPSGVARSPALTELDLVRAEEAAEAEAIGGDVGRALARLTFLKAVNAAHERKIEQLSASLVAQHELLHDVVARVSELAAAVPPPASLEPDSAWYPIAAALVQLHHRCQRGLAPKVRPSRAAAADSSSRSGGAHGTALASR